MVEHLTFNQVVAGSIPAPLTNFLHIMVTDAAPKLAQRLRGVA